MKIGVLLARYSISGVPLAQIRLARAFAARGHDVELIVGHVDPETPIPGLSGIKVRVCDRPTVRGMLFPLMRYLRADQPDAVFSAEDHLNTVVLLAAVLVRSKAKISGSSRVTPFDTYSKKPFSKRWILKHMTNALMWRADALTCVSKDMVTQYRQVFPSPPHVCVYNIVSDKASRHRMLEQLDHPWVSDPSVPLVVAAGRLAPWKGFADLIRAIKLVPLPTGVRLIILGDGPMRAELEGLIAELGLQDVIQLPGYVENPLKYYARANVFALSSLVEGMPNVLVEAMMCGCTPVATDCPTGPSELLQGGRYGYLVPVGDPAAMAEAIAMAVAHPIPKETLLQAIAPFEEQAVLDRHFEALGL